MQPTCALARPCRTVIEIDPLDPSGGILVTLRTWEAAGDPSGESLVALSGHLQLEELPELLRVVGLELVFGDPPRAHRAVGQLLVALCDR